MPKKPKEPPAENNNIDFEIQKSVPEVEEKSSFMDDIKTEWNLFWETLFDDDDEMPKILEDSSQSMDPFENGKLEVLTLDKIKVITKALSSDRKKLHQRLEEINKELDENSAKLESLALVGGHAEETEFRISHLSDLGHSISEQLNRINDRLKMARQREDAIKKNSRDKQ
jgi:chromosome segregation ATPase